MCGIAGILRTWQPGDAPPAMPEAIPESWLDILDESIKHRGPDGQGRFRQRVVRDDGTTVDVALVHRRLSIIDHAGGAQPMVIGAMTRSPGLQSGPGGAGRWDGRSKAGGAGEKPAPSEVGRARWSAAPTEVGGSEGVFVSREGLPYGPLKAHVCPKCGPGVVAVVFNGCIYNHRELRRELEAAGHEFFTDHSDTEVLLHGWREWGSGLLHERVDGMCAAACWDAERAALYSLRARFGEKPLYELVHDNGNVEAFAISSSLPGLLPLRHLLGAPCELEANGLREWLAMGWSPTGTPFARIAQLPAPGFSIAPRGMKGSPWMRTLPPTGVHARNARPQSLRTIADVQRLLERSVRSRLEADVPLGCFLSGGVDSSLVAHFAKCAVGSLRTFSVKMPGPRYDESTFAERAAVLVGSKHETLSCDPRPTDDLYSLITQLGLPFGDSSLLPTHWISSAAREHVRVVLTGDGGDELFCGYERHSIDPVLQRLRLLSMPLRLVPPAALRGRDPKSRRSKAGRLIIAAAYRGYQDLVAIFPTPDHRATAGRHAGRWFHEGMYGSEHGRVYDVAHYLAGDLMRKSDTGSMAVALEARSPFLARELVDSALATSVSTLMPHGQRKGLLRAVARKYLPAEIVDRPKMGFAIPIGEWFRSDYGSMRQLLYDHLESADPFPGLPEAGVELNMDFVRRMLREHDAAGERSLNPWHGRDHSQRLYMLLVLSIWCRWLRSL